MNDKLGWREIVKLVKHHITIMKEMIVEIGIDRITRRVVVGRKMGANGTELVAQQDV